MKIPYVIVLDDGFPRGDLIEKMKNDSRFGAWFYSMPNSFIVYAGVNANAIDEFIKENVGDKYRYFITEISAKNRQGWMPKTHWEILYHCGAQKFFALDFQGYYTDSAKLPIVSGVFCVYQCVYNQAEKSVLINELLYIGSSVNVREGCESVQMMMRSNCSDNQTLCYSFAPVSDSDLDWCVSALRKASQCKLREGTDSPYTYGDAYVETRGKNSMLPSGVLVEKSSNGRG